MKKKARKGALTKSGHVRGSSDPELRYATVLDPKLEQWRVLAAEWLATVKSNNGLALTSVRNFLVDYIHGQKLTTNPAEFLRAGYSAPCFYTVCLSHLKGRIRERYGFVSRFIEHVLLQ